MNKGQLIADDTPDTIVQEYAQPVLHIKTDCLLKNEDNLKRLLQQSVSSASIQLKAQSARVEMNLDTPVNQSKILAAVLQVFQAQQLAVTECRWEEAGLENAYFKLTGAKISSPSGLKNKQKSQRKRC